MKLLLIIILSIPMMVFSMEIRVPSTSNTIEKDRFEIDLLNFLLHKSNTKYSIKPVGYMTQARIIKELYTGKKIDLYWMGTSKELEETLRPIRVPVYRGLIGYRVFLINKKNKNKLEKVAGLVDLQKLRGIQGQGWSDIPILEAAGLKQHRTLYHNILSMLDAGRKIDYFSRGVNEAYDELEVRKERYPNITIDQNVLLVYKFAMFFFTSRENKSLANAISRGFELSYKDGSFIEFFYSHPKIINFMRKSKIKKRVRINIHNPLLSHETSTLPPNLWHRY